MSKILIDEDKLRELLGTQFTLNTLENGGIDNIIAYEESFGMDLEWWNRVHPEEQYEDWDDMAQAVIDAEVKGYKKKDNYIYLLWEDKVIIGCYTSLDAANEALYDILNNDNIVEVKWANESCGFTTVKTSFGETIEYEIGEVRING